MTLYQYFKAILYWLFPPKEKIKTTMPREYAEAVGIGQTTFHKNAYYEIIKIDDIQDKPDMVITTLKRYRMNIK